MHKVNTTLFDQASVRYKNKDYRGALRGYTACLQDTSVPFSLGEVGLIYHRIGNCLVKLKSYTEAIQAYRQALDDSAYEAKGSLQNNIGMAYASLHDYQNAADCFQAAINDTAYDAVYKAYMGLGNAQLKLGNSAEAGVAFREAALDEANPDPAKALLNLGICFMALDRPSDAILSYESALEFDMTEDTRNRINASMGQAYVANGQMEEALAAFEAAIADATYVLSDSASVDHQKAISEVARIRAAAEGGSTSMAGQTQVLGSGMTVQTSNAVMPGADADTSGLDVQVTDAFMPQGQVVQDNEFAYEANGNYPGYIDAYDNTTNTFFDTSDSELEELSRSMAKKDRRNRNVGLKVLIVLIVIVLLALGASVVLYMQGFGIPTQQSVVQQLFANPESAQSEGLFAEGLSDSTVKSMLDPVVQADDAQLTLLEAQTSDSLAYVSAGTGHGGYVNYKISMVRDFIGWKISGIELYFPSQNQ